MCVCVCVCVCVCRLLGYIKSESSPRSRQPDLLLPLPVRCRTKYLLPMSSRGHHIRYAHHSLMVIATCRSDIPEASVCSVFASSSYFHDVTSQRDRSIVRSYDHVNAVLYFCYILIAAMLATKSLVLHCSLIPLPPRCSILWTSGILHCCAALYSIILELYLVEPVLHCRDVIARGLAVLQYLRQAFLNTSRTLSGV